MRVFVAGATGAIGRPLVQCLLADGHQVTGTTRSEEGAERLRAVGAVPAVLDLTELGLMTNILFGADPDVVINQVTSLPQTPEPEAVAEGVATTSKLRRQLYPRLAEAAAAAGAGRLIVQSTAFGPTDGTDVRDVIEQSAMDAKDIDAIILRYGYFYGPGTWSEERPSASLDGDENAPFVHIEDAAAVTALAVSKGEPGTYVISDDAKAGAAARKAFGWKPR